jgi:glyoxylase-like metal-dependent hydrolase (beta-lactamase superfamily II)
MNRVCLLVAIVLGGALAVVGADLSAQAPAAGGQGRGARGGGGMGPVGAIEKVADNLYMIPGAGGNTAVFVTAKGVVLVDTKLANNGQAILDQVKTVSDRPVTHVLNTHTHGDHTGSNMFFPAAVEVVTQENTAANMKKMKEFADEAGKQGLPDRTFAERLTLLSGNDAIDLYYFGRAHTDGDALIVFRNARVIHTGDMFATKGMPFIDAASGGSVLAAGETIGKAAGAIKNVDRVIPGHSAVVPWQDFVDYGEFNRLFVEHGRASMKAGKTPEQAMMDLKLPDKFKGYTLTAPFGRGGGGGNFVQLYDEMKGR